MPSLTVKDLQELKGVRQIAFVQVANEEEAIAASTAGMDMIGTGFRPETQHFASLVPDSHFQFGLAWGGMRAVGRTAQQAEQVYHDSKAFESAGAFALEMEVVPAQVAAEITRNVSLLTISLGSGTECDATYLFSADLLGENRGHIPRHAKVYRNFAEERDRLQQERIAAYREYRADVENTAYPTNQHDVTIKPDEFEKFLDSISNKH